jgi:predicted nucleic acid-binding protein
VKQFFSSFTKPSEKQVEKSLEEDLIFLDTNVLLNLYRYNSQTRDKLLEVLRALSGRVWLTSYSGLEYFRNRLGVIQQQYRRFQEVKDAVEAGYKDLNTSLDNLQLEKRHSVISTTEFRANLVKERDRLFKSLDEWREKEITIGGDDPVLSAIVEIVGDKMTDMPDQAKVDGWDKLAKERYEKGVPPGFRDVGKSTGEHPYAYFQGVTFSRAHGDYYIWVQVLEIAEKLKSSVIFVTDDEKEDWWNRVGSSRTQGPRPELCSEFAARVPGGRLFMYTSARFLELAASSLNTEVQQATIDEVRDVSNSMGRLFAKRSLEESLINDRVISWIDARFPASTISKIGPGRYLLSEIIGGGEINVFVDIVLFEARERGPMDTRHVVGRRVERISRRVLELPAGEKALYIVACKDDSVAWELTSYFRSRVQGGRLESGGVTLAVVVVPFDEATESAGEVVLLEQFGARI